MSARKKWIRRYKAWIAPTPMSGVWEHQEGGYLVRSRVVDPATGRMKEIKKVLRDADFGAACQWLEQERARVAAGIVRAPADRTRFGEYARAVLDRKVALREIRSAKGRE